MWNLYIHEINFVLCSVSTMMVIIGLHIIVFKSTAFFKYSVRTLSVCDVPFHLHALILAHLRKLAANGFKCVTLLGAGACERRLSQCEVVFLPAIQDPSWTLKNYVRMKERVYACVCHATCEMIIVRGKSVSVIKWYGSYEQCMYISECSINANCSLLERRLVTKTRPMSKLSIKHYSHGIEHSVKCNAFGLDSIHVARSLFFLYSIPL